jgi:hypothetical protein
LPFLPLVLESQTKASPGDKDELIRDAQTTSRRTARPTRPWATTGFPFKKDPLAVESLGGVCVHWRAAGDEDVAPMRNLNLGGLYVETDTPEFLAFLAFLVLAKGHVCKTEQTLLF